MKTTLTTLAPSVGLFLAAYFALGAAGFNRDTRVAFGAGTALDAEFVKSLMAALLAGLLPLFQKKWPDWLNLLREALGVKPDGRIDDIRTDVKAIRDKLGA